MLICMLIYSCWGTYCICCSLWTQELSNQLNRDYKQLEQLCFKLLKYWDPGIVYSTEHLGTAKKEKNSEYGMNFTWRSSTRKVWGDRGPLQSHCHAALLVFLMKLLLGIDVLILEILWKVIVSFSITTLKSAMQSSSLLLTLEYWKEFKKEHEEIFLPIELWHCLMYNTFLSLLYSTNE